MILNPPYGPEEVKQINTFQRLVDKELFSQLECRCGGKLYAREEGLICRVCNNTQDEVPLFIANGNWNRFKKKELVEPEAEEE